MLLAIDQGTTGTTCLVFDVEGELVGRAYREFTQHFPQPGWVEHDAAEIWDVTHAVAGEALDDAGVEPGELEAIGITNQRETVCVWDPATGEPLHRALVWQDRRTAARCDELREAGHEALRPRRAPASCSTRTSAATKIEWLLRNVDGLARAGRATGRAVFGTIDAWLVFKLTGEHVTDADERLAHAALRHRRRALGRRAARAASACPSARCPRSGRARRVRPHAPACCHGHDGARRRRRRRPAGRALRPGAASIPGSGKNTYGTGSFVLLNAGTSAPPAPDGPARDDRLGDRRRRTIYALEAAIFVTGAAVQWLRDGLGIIERRRRDRGARRARWTPTTASTSSPR